MGVTIIICITVAVVLIMLCMFLWRNTDRQNSYEDVRNRIANSNQHQCDDDGFILGAVATAIVFGSDGDNDNGDE